MRIYVIRHGQTDWNVEHRIQGSQDIPLNAAGIRQAERLAEAMKEHPVELVFSSPQKRALRTAQMVADVQGAVLVPLPQLVEISYGAWEGRTSEDILAADGALYESWWKHPAEVAPPGGETLRQVDGRCARAWELIREELQRQQITGDIAVVAHGGILAHFMVHLLKQSGESASDIVVANASITTVLYDPESGSCRLERLNDCAHLRETAV